MFESTGPKRQHLGFLVSLSRAEQRERERWLRNCQPSHIKKAESLYTHYVWWGIITLNLPSSTLKPFSIGYFNHIERKHRKLIWCLKFPFKQPQLTGPPKPIPPWNRFLTALIWSIYTKFCFYKCFSYSSAKEETPFATTHSYNWGQKGTAKNDGYAWHISPWLSFSNQQQTVHISRI